MWYTLSGWENYWCGFQDYKLVSYVSKLEQGVLDINLQHIKMKCGLQLRFVGVKELFIEPIPEGGIHLSSTTQIMNRKGRIWVLRFQTETIYKSARTSFIT